MFTLALAIYLFFRTETKLALTAPPTEEMVRVGEPDLNIGRTSLSEVLPI